MDSFRAELVGILSAQVYVKLLLQQKDTKNTPRPDVTIFTDSESSIKRILGNKDAVPCSMKEANSKEFPLVQEIRNQIGTNRANITLKWVKSHQDQNQALDARMNKAADEHANLQHSEKGQWRSRERMGMLPLQRVQIFFDGDQYDRDYKLQARRHYHGPTTEAYIQRKLCISNEAMGLIDWTSIKTTNAQLSKKSTCHPLQIYIQMGIYVSEGKFLHQGRDTLSVM